MDLRRIKTIFIIILLVINITLTFVLYNAKSYEREEKEAMVENLTALLAQEMIYLPDTVEVPDSPEIYNFYLEKMFGSNNEMVEKLLGKDYKATENGSYVSDLGRLTVLGDEFRLEWASPQGSVEDFSQDKIKKLCNDEMERLGIMSRIYEFNGFNYIDSGVKAIFTVKHDKAEFFDAYISFDVTHKGICGISGKNIISDLSASGGSTPYFNVVSILADFAKSEKLSEKAAHTIVSIKAGYYIGKNTESYRNIMAIPVWQIATDGGVILHYDARNGKEIQE